MKTSAGILLYRIITSEPEVFLVHPGGPFWKNKDTGAWSIPKGEYTMEEDPLQAAIREFREETGISVSGTFLPLEPIKQKSGKLVSAWALRSNPVVSSIVSNTFQMEWPLKSGQFIEVPEIDKAAWFSVEEARKKILPAQVALIDDLLNKVILRSP